MQTEYELLLRPDKINFAPADIVEEVLQNVLTICTTIKFSVPLDREVGVAADFVDEPVNRVRARFASEVINAVRKFEPRARVTRINFDGNYDGAVYPRVFVRIVT